MQDETALYGAKMMQPGMTAADSEENNLRPQHLEDYIGQEKVKQNLKIYLEAAKRRGEPMDHILLYGHKAFKAASGVGPKLAQRIVLELKDKVAKGFAAGIDLENVAGAASDTAAAQGAGQAIAALVSLGYSQSEAALAVSKIDGTLPVEEIIKLALRSMAGRR